MAFSTTLMPTKGRHNWKVRARPWFTTWAGVGPGRAADLSPGAAEGGSQEAGDDGGPDAGGRRDAGGDGESHSQGQCQNAHGDARREVLAELGPVVARQAIEELGAKGDFHGTRS